MTRRQFITLLGGVAVAWPLAARAEQSAMPVIGIVGGNTGTEWQPFMTAFKLGLQEARPCRRPERRVEFRWLE
jgi:putative tryptophan/tyrosine transport system substrate-binding protein